MTCPNCVKKWANWRPQLGLTIFLLKASDLGAFIKEVISCFSSSYSALS